MGGGKSRSQPNAARASLARLIRWVRQEGMLPGHGWCRKVVSTNGELIALMGGGRCIVIRQEGGVGWPMAAEWGLRRANSHCWRLAKENGSTPLRV